MPGWASRNLPHDEAKSVPSCCFVPSFLISCIRLNDPRPVKLTLRALRSRQVNFVNEPKSLCQWQLQTRQTSKWLTGPNLENPIPILVGIHEVNFLTMRRQRHTGWQVPGTGTGIGTEYGWWMLWWLLERVSEPGEPDLFRFVCKCNAMSRQRGNEVSACVSLWVSCLAKERAQKIQTHTHTHSTHAQRKTNNKRG